MNKPASIRARLLNKAKAENKDFSLILIRYALERLLYRLSISSSKDNFLLKGALLFDMWFDVPYRSTRDIDLLGFGLAEEPLVYEAFSEICGIDCDDGLIFDANSIRIAEIRKEANYFGLRVTLIGHLDGARSLVQVDIGYGDAVTPAPDLAEYPVMLKDLPAPKLRVYPRYTVVAEKFEAIVSLGMANTRLKDYFDLWILLKTQRLDPELLKTAIAATLNRRKTIMPASTPVGLTSVFGEDAQKTKQWQAFIKKNQLKAPALHLTIDFIQEKLKASISNINMHVNE
jgi:predicted nucleotidyltransferase component of viral defense system